jgi:hypothetical protein
MSTAAPVGSPGILLNSASTPFNGSEWRTPMSQDKQIERATQVQHKYEAELMQKPHVVGVAIGLAKQKGRTTTEVALIVMVDEKVPQAELDPEDCIPERLDGVRVDVQEMGTFTAQ